jgi:hypothetical protein
MRDALCTVLLLALASCGDGGGGLGRADVEHLPAGDAQGSALSGSWSVSRRITGCSGACTVQGFAVCDVGGTVDGRAATITQTDGALTVTVDDNPGYFEGGAFADGSFHLGGYATAQGGEIEEAALIDGTATTDSMTATARAHIWGGGLDCDIADTITAIRNP